MIITDFYFSDAQENVLQEKHMHNTYQLIYVQEGEMSIKIAGKEVQCCAPALVFIGNCEPHAIVAASKNYKRYVLTLHTSAVNTHVRPEVLQSIFFIRYEGFSHCISIAPIHEEIRSLIELLFAEYNLPSEEKLLEGELLLLSTLLYRIRQFSPAHFSARKFTSAEKIVLSLRSKLEGSFEQKLNLDELAAQHYVSRYYLAHIFKQQTGYSLKEYMMLCRISYTCQELANSLRSVQEIAESAGFHDMSNFLRAFKKMIGVSPSEFRKQSIGNLQALP